MEDKDKSEYLTIGNLSHDHQGVIVIDHNPTPEELRELTSRPENKGKIIVVEEGEALTMRLPPSNVRALGEYVPSSKPCAPHHYEKQEGGTWRCRDCNRDM